MAKNKIIEGITYVALAADHLLTVVLGGKGLKGGFNNATTETKDKMESRFLFVNTQVSISILPRIPISQLQKPYWLMHGRERRVFCTFWML